MKRKHINSLVLDLKCPNLRFKLLLVLFNNLLDSLMFSKIIHLKFFQNPFGQCGILYGLDFAFPQNSLIEFAEVVVEDPLVVVELFVGETFLAALQAEEHEDYCEGL